MYKINFKYEQTPLRIKFLFVLFLILSCYYFNWRIHTLNPEAPIFSSLLLAAEIYGLVTGLVHFMMTARLTIRESITPEENLTVDVFIPTYNESIDIVKRTLVASLEMEYPHTTWILDDGNRPELKKLTESLGAKYLARQSREYAKAGNLNYGLSHSSGKYIAIFDADHVPHEKFLAKTLGYFRDEKVAFVQTPQDFYNLDSFQHRMNQKKGLMWTEQSLFFRVIQKGKDFWNAAFFCGSCAVVRRSALEKINGFAIETITEDLHTSIKLHKKGYTSIYHPDSLAFGIAPATIEPFISQRIRWGQGAMQVLKKENILFDGVLTLGQKINYIASILTYLDGWQKGLFYITPIVVLLTGWIPISAEWSDLLLYLLPFVIINFLLTEELARGYGRTYFIEEYNMARFFAFIYATLFLVIPKKLKFKVTKKENLGNEKSIFLMPQKIIFYLTLVATPFGILLFLNDKLTLESLSISIFWASINAFLAYSVISFAKVKASFKRSNYRFKLPIISTIQTNELEIFTVFTDISIDGFKMYGRIPEQLKVHDFFKGTLHLPTQNLKFTAQILNLPRVPPVVDGDYCAAGCVFIWDEDKSQKSSLEKFLYGSADQLNLVGISEKSYTPIENLLTMFSRNPSKKINHNFEKWLPVLSANDQPIGTCHLIDKQDGDSYYAILNNSVGEAELNSIKIDKLILNNPKFEKKGQVSAYDCSYLVCTITGASDALSK